MSKKLHLRTQNDQPYGSVRRCCERCGVMLWPGQEKEPWTDDPNVYAEPPEGYVRCIAK
jgi:hypothetical protein